MLATLFVTSEADSGPGTLRQAIDQANLGTGGDTISFALTIHNILLQSGLTISQSMTVTGPGAGTLKVARDTSAANVGPFSLFTVTATASVAISGMSVGQLLLIAVLVSLLAQIGWRSVFVWIGIAHLALLPLLLALPGASVAQPSGAVSLSLREAARTGRFWLLLAIYAICGLDDFFVTTHVAAFAQDRGLGILAAGNLLAFMGLTGLAGVIASGLASDRLGPVWPTAAAFAARVIVFGWIAIDQSPLSRCPGLSPWCIRSSAASARMRAPRSSMRPGRMTPRSC